MSEEIDFSKPYPENNGMLNGLSPNAKVEIRRTKTLEKGDNKVKEGKTLSNGVKVFIIECPHCQTEYRYEDIEELKLVKGYFDKVHTELGTGIEVWVKLVKCECGKLFVPTIKRVYEEPKQVEIKEEDIIKKPPETKEVKETVK